MPTDPTPAQIAAKLAAIIARLARVRTVLAWGLEYTPIPAASTPLRSQPVPQPVQTNEGAITVFDPQMDVFWSVRTA